MKGKSWGYLAFAFLVFQDQPDVKTFVDLSQKPFPRSNLIQLLNRPFGSASHRFINLMDMEFPTTSGLAYRPVFKKAVARPVLSLFFSLMAASLFAATNTWTGGSSIDWFTNSNWSLGAVPLAADDVSIPSGTPFSPTIGAAGAVAKMVTVNTGATLTVSAAGTLAINGSLAQGLLNNGTVLNSGIINTGNISANSFAGVLNTGNFTINSGAKLTIDRSNVNALANNAGTFTNKGMLIIGAAVGSPGTGIVNGGTFINDFNATISIDRMGVSGITNLNGTFTNKASIAIGATAGVGDVGIVNAASFDNTFFGTITIDRFNLRGLDNSGTFKTRGNLTIGSTGLNGPNAVTNYGAGTFENGTVCGLITIYASLVNWGTFTQDGRLVSNTLSAHTNTGTFTNEGVIMYPLGNPIPGAVNNEIIAQPVIGSCSDIPNVLSLGSPVDFAPTTPWFLDPSLTMVAGTYDQATNTLTPTGFAPNVPKTVYFQVEVPDCGFLTVSLTVQYGQSPPAPNVAVLQAFCSGDSPTVASLSPNGANFVWYNVPTGGAPLAPNTPLVNGGDYYVSQIIGGCQSFRAHVRAIVTTPAPGKVCLNGCSN